MLRQAYQALGSDSTAEGEPRSVALSLEFFQRDAQPILDEYLAGLITEKAFLAASRPWPRYQTDYRPHGRVRQGAGPGGRRRQRSRGATPTG